MRLPSTLLLETSSVAFLLLPMPLMMPPIKLPQEFYDLTSRAILPMEKQIVAHCCQALALPRDAVVAQPSPSGFRVLVLILSKRRKHRKRKELLIAEGCRQQFGVTLEFKYTKDRDVLVAVDTAQRLGRGWAYCQEMGLTWVV